MNFIFLIILTHYFCAVKTNLLSDDFINFINSINTTWIAQKNFHGDISIEKLKLMNGAFKDPEIYNNIEIKIHNVTEKIPKSFDSRKYWPECESIGKIRNQGFCGSCWAFGAVESMTDRVCIFSKGTEKFQLSAENLLSCCKNCGNGCNGGYSSRAWSYWVTDGIVSGGDYNSNQGCQPYTQLPFANNTTPQCTSKCSNPSYKKSYHQDKNYGFNNYRLPQDIQQIQYEIMRNGPVQATYEVFEDFYSYKKGVYQHIQGKTSGYHAVKIIGWGVENQTPYWLIANSWGTQWGDLGGFFKILRGSNHCGIETNILGGQPKLQKSLYTQWINKVATLFNSKNS